ncbi:MAG TPA: Hpt domain-containing protein [Acidimicrobiales bacterium]|nr:Hpt domain-containing protein [Acidimicrobiales bacterium]
MTEQRPPVEALDFRILAEYEQMSPGLAAELTSMFLDDVPGRLEALRAALRTGDLRAVGHLSHTLKGTSSNLGAGHLAAICGDLQIEAEGGSTAAAAAMLESIEQAWEQLKEMLPAAVEAAAGSAG